jgi:hypothetical protein
MRPALFLCAGLALLLAPAIPAIAPAHARADSSRCGVGLVAGVAGCITWHMKISEYKALVARAHAGDNAAALELAGFEEMREDRDVREPGRKWRLLAAERGDCNAIRGMLEGATRAKRSAEASRWQTRMRWNQCPADWPAR